MAGVFYEMLVTGLKEAVDYARGKSPALVAKYEDGKLVCRKRKMADGTEVSGYQPWKVAIWIMKIMAREKKWVKSWSRAKKKARAPLKNKTTRVLCYHAVLFLPVSLSLRGYRFFFAECARTPIRVIPARPNRIKNSHSAGADRSPVGGSAFLTVKGAEASPSS